MPITPYLAHQAFEPEIIQTDALYLKIGADPAARFVAEKVIELEVVRSSVPPISPDRMLLRSQRTDIRRNPPRILSDESVITQR